MPGFDFVSVSTPAAVPTVYWRPGCPYCASLRRRLRKFGVATREVNIWADPAGAATVRAITGGDETVPTVVYGDARLVNPSANTVLRLVGGPENAAAAPSPFGVEPWRLARWVAVAAVLVASLVADALGHGGLSWALDGLAAVVYALMGVLRS